MTEAERHQLLVEWNNTQANYPKDSCIHQLFEAQVERTPDAVAVVFEDQQLTYRELNCRANQLAHYLQQLDVRPEDLVGICVERSLEMVVGLLGILKAGGVYVPLDPWLNNSTGKGRKWLCWLCLIPLFRSFSTHYHFTIGPFGIWVTFHD